MLRPTLTLLCWLLSGPLLAADLSSKRQAALQPGLSAPTAHKQPERTPTARIAIIIDDMGYRAALGRRAIELPGAFTYAILPFAPNSLSLARAAHARGKELMLHAPMSNTRGLPLDEGALTTEMDHQTFINTLEQSLDALPFIQGVNNHMGSALTQTSQPMRWLMASLKQRQLYFVDSRTSAASQAWTIAREHRVPTLKRDVFLDHKRDPAAIASAFARLLRIARRNGNALAIGHPYPETLSFLETALSSEAMGDVELVSVSTLVDQDEAASTE